MRSLSKSDSRHGTDSSRSPYNLGEGGNSSEAKHSIKWSSQNIEVSYEEERIQQCTEIVN